MTPRILAALYLLTCECYRWREHCAGLAGVRPVAAHLLPVFLVGIVEFELLVGGAAIDILLRQIDEVLLTEAAFRLRARRHRFGQRHADARLLAGQDLLAI
jgi:hypothetical protein